jgi:GTP-binding protein
MQEITFIDEAVVHVEAGSGGAGCVAFRREKFVPLGGPSGGDGGHGGSVVLKATSRYNTLFHFQKYPHHRAGKGENGKGAQKTGAGGDDLCLEIPVGTLVHDVETAELLGDLNREGEILTVARGGRGGKGNAHFKSSTNRAPRFARPGEEGEIRTLKLELKLISDVGFVGLPNAGKSTLLSRISAARPKVAPYPFTTLNPYLGVVPLPGGRAFVAAEIPGLIEGAHLGQGLGLKFLRHAERCKALCQLVDPNGEDPVKDANTVLKELAEHEVDLSAKVRLVAVTKMDTVPSSDALKKIRAWARRKKLACLGVSAVSGQGIGPLTTTLWELCK